MYETFMRNSPGHEWKMHFGFLALGLHECISDYDLNRA